MKYTIITTLLLIPCLAAFNEGKSILPNIIGLSYMAALVFASRTRIGKAFLRKLENETNRINEITRN